MGKNFESFDFLIILPVLILSGFSLALLGSSKPGYFIDQLIFFIIGFFLYFLFKNIDFSIFKSLSPLFYLLSLSFLILAFFGPYVRGTTRWIEIFNFRFQSSELVKPFLIISFAAFFSKLSRKNFKSLLTGFFLLIIPFFLIFKQPDLGNALVILGIWISIIYAWGLPLFYAILGILGIAGVFPVIFRILKSYQRERFLSFLNPNFDRMGAGYHSLQATIAIGSGEVFGRGLGFGTQGRLLFLPESHTDFIFAWLIEELGFLGGLVVILAYCVLLLRILSIGKNLKFSCESLFVFGVFAQFFLHIFINIGMNLGILPITGITLPFLSYGGSSIIANMISLGIVANISKNKTRQASLDIGL